MTTLEANNIIETAIKQSFLAFCKNIALTKKITQEEFDMVHDFRNWLINDLSKKGKIYAT